MEIKVNYKHTGLEIKDSPPDVSTKWCIACKGYFDQWYEEEGYRNMIFEGTKKEVDDFVEDLHKDEKDFKVIGYFEYNSEKYYHFIHGPLWRELI